MRISSVRSASSARPSAAASGSAGIRRRIAARGMALAMTAALAPAAAAVVAAPAAQAHSTLVGTTPEQGATVETSPESVEVVFNEEISSDFAMLTVMSDGEDVAEGDPEVDGDSISVSVPSLEAGTYTVGYRVVSADGHPVQGSWEFTVGGGAGSATEAPGAEAGATESNTGENAGSSNDQPADADDSTEAADEADEGGINVFAAIGILAVLAIALIGGAAFLLQRHKKNMAQFHQDDQ